MKKFLIGLFCLSLTLVTNAQQSDKYTGSLLWKVSGNGLDKPSYILGTHHLANKSILETISGFQKSLDACDKVVGELDLSDKSGVNEKMEKAVQLPAGSKSYKEILSDADFQRLDGHLTSMFGQGMQVFASFKPGFLSSMASIMMYAKGEPSYNPQTHQAIDEIIQKMASDKGKTLGGLETIEIQIEALFNTGTMEEQIKDLLCMFDNLDKSMRDLTKLNEAYNKGDLSKMYEVSFGKNAVCQISDESKKAISDNRNNNWLKDLPSMMKKESLFVAVGALHLAGEEGLLFQLDEMGYTIEPVK